VLIFIVFKKHYVLTFVFWENVKKSCFSLNITLLDTYLVFKL